MSESKANTTELHPKARPTSNLLFSSLYSKMLRYTKILTAISDNLSLSISPHPLLLYIGIWWTYAVQTKSLRGSIKHTSSMTEGTARIQRDTSRTKNPSCCSRGFSTITITSIPCPISICILLARVGNRGTIVAFTGDLWAVDRRVRPAVTVSV